MNEESDLLPAGDPREKLSETRPEVSLGRRLVERSFPNVGGLQQIGFGVSGFVFIDGTFERVFKVFFDTSAKSFDQLPALGKKEAWLTEEAGVLRQLGVVSRFPPELYSTVVKPQYGIIEMEAVHFCSGELFKEDAGCVVGAPTARIIGVCL